MPNRFLITLIFAFITTFSLAQDQAVVREYINRYRLIAIDEMKRTGVPAAITLAQGIHETEAGQSDLVTSSNNHFGIKCKDTWTGDYVLHDDDARQECFRKYDSPQDSYRDHSDFLKNSRRYAALFQLDPEDYEGWAWGLKKAGYATNPKYPQILIRLILEYNLQDYTLIALGKLNGEELGLAKNDGENKPSIENETIPKENETESVTVVELYPSGEFRINDTKVIFVKKGTAYLTLAQQNDISLARLFEFNDMNPKDIADSDQLIYLQRKRKKGASEFHIVQKGETVFMISQKEAIRLESLMEYNLLAPGMQPAIGEKLNLHSKATYAPRLVVNKKVDDEFLAVADQSKNSSFSFASETSHTKKPEIVFHIVQPKETLYTIAKKYDIRLDEIADWNQLQNFDLKIGQQLKIYKKRTNAIH